MILDFCKSEDEECSLIERYEEIRLSGRYNMLTDAEFVADELGINLQEYFKILPNYSALANIYLNK